jgi:hypothetical protein
MELPPVTTIKATLQIEERAQEAEECSFDEHPAALAAPVLLKLRGGVCSELLTIPAIAKKIASLIAQAFTTRCSASLALVWTAILN